MFPPRSYSSLPPCPPEPSFEDAECAPDCDSATSFSRAAIATVERRPRGRIYIATVIAVGCCAVAFLVADYFGRPRLGLLRRKTAMGAVQLDVTRTCAGHEIGCLYNKTCANGLQCYEKAPGIWAACKNVCVPGEPDPCDEYKFRTPWSCKWLGGPLVETTVPVGTWDEAMEALIDGKSVIPQTETTTTTTTTQTTTSQTTTSTSQTTTSATLTHSTMTTVTRKAATRTTATTVTTKLNANNNENHSVSLPVPVHTTTVTSLVWRTSITSATTTTSTDSLVFQSTEASTTRRSSEGDRSLCGHLEQNMNYQTGEVLKVLHPIHRPEECCVACAAVPDCKAWTWAPLGADDVQPSACYLKPAVPTASEKKYSDGLVSGEAREVKAVAEDAVSNVRTKATSLFCYMVITSTGYEPEIVRAQLQERLGIFACQSFTVLSQSESPMHLGHLSSEPIMTIPIPGPDAWLAPVPNTNQKVWHNTNVFGRAWRKLFEDGEFRKHDWSVKVDADAVFAPWRLIHTLDARGLSPEERIFFLNCAEWKSLQGPLEVLSRAASEAFFAPTGQQECFRQLDWSNWGEDWFVQNCLTKLGAHAEDGYDFLEDQWCTHSWVNCGDESKVAYHPFKKLENFMNCKQQAGASSKLLFRKMQDTVNIDDALLIRK